MVAQFYLSQEQITLNLISFEISQFSMLRKHSSFRKLSIGINERISTQYDQNKSDVGSSIQNFRRQYFKNIQVRTPSQFKEVNAFRQPDYNKITRSITYLSQQIQMKTQKLNRQLKNKEDMIRFYQEQNHRRTKRHQIQKQQKAKAYNQNIANIKALIELQQSKTKVLQKIIKKTKNEDIFFSNNFMQQSNESSFSFDMDKYIS